MVRAYDRRRRLVVDGFNRWGGLLRAAGRVLRLPIGEKDRHDQPGILPALLREQKVAAVPGDAFGAGGEGHFRVSYAASAEKLAEAIDRIGKFLHGNG